MNLPDNPLTRPPGDGRTNGAAAGNPVPAGGRARSARWSLTAAGGGALGIYLLATALGALGALTSSAGPVTPSAARLSVWWIFWHNFGTCLWLTGGLATAGLVTAGVLALNGMVLGWVAAKQYTAGHGGLVVTGILPHLPLELLAYVISGGATMLVGFRLAANLFRKTGPRRDADWRAWALSQACAVILLFLAAIVEAYVAHA